MRHQERWLCAFAMGGMLASAPALAADHADSPTLGGDLQAADVNDLYTFMHNDTFEQLSLPNETLTDAIPYLKENDKVSMLMRDDVPVTVEVANHVELLIAKCDPGVRGDTAQGGTKPATLETGLTVQVPLFVEEGETIRVDTRTGDYMNRV